MAKRHRHTLSDPQQIKTDAPAKPGTFRPNIQSAEPRWVALMQTLRDIRAEARRTDLTPFQIQDRIACLVEDVLSKEEGR